MKTLRMQRARNQYLINSLLRLIQHVCVGLIQLVEEIQNKTLNLTQYTI